MSEQQRPRRRQLIVDKAAQSRMILHISIFPALALTITSILVAVFCARIQNEALRAEIELPSLVPLLITIFGFVTVSALFILMNAIRISNKVAGPAFNMERVLRTFREGDRASRVHLREGDQLLRLQDEINMFLEWAAANLPERCAVSPASTETTTTTATVTETETTESEETAPEPVSATED